MGVYVIRNQPNYLRAGLFGQAFNVLGDQIGGMIKRSQDAADAKGLQKSIGLFSDAMRPQKGLDVPAWEPVEEPSFSAAFNKYLNNNMVSKNVSENVWKTTPGLGKDVVGDVNDFTHALSQINPKHIPYVAELGKSLYGDRIANQEKARYAGESRESFLNNGGIDRSNTNLSFANVAELTGRGIDTKDALTAFYPNVQGTVVDTGDKQVPVTFDGGTGTWGQGKEMTKGVDTTQKYVADTGLQQTKINARATRAASAGLPKYTMFQGEDGGLYSYDQRSGIIYKDGQPVQGVKGPQTDSNVKNALAFLASVQKMYQFTDMPPEVQEQVQAAQAIVAGSFAGGGQNPSPTPAPTPTTAPTAQGGYMGYSEENIQAAMKQFGMTRDQVIAQINMEMAQGGY